MYRYLIAFLALALVFVSCKSDDDTKQEQQVEENFYALTVGNSWNYEFYNRVGKTDDFENMEVYISVEITGTAQINGEEYYVFTTTTTGNDNGQAPCNDNGVNTEHLRDSLGFLVNEYGKTFYSQLSMDPYLRNSEAWGDLYGVLKDEMVEITVEAGSFSTKENEIYLITPDDLKTLGRDRHYYTDGIGLIQMDYSTVLNPIHRWEKRLISFEVIEE